MVIAITTTTTTTTTLPYYSKDDYYVCCYFTAHHQLQQQHPATTRLQHFQIRSKFAKQCFCNPWRWIRFVGKDLRFMKIACCPSLLNTPCNPTLIWNWGKPVLDPAMFLFISKFHFCFWLILFGVGEFQIWSQVACISFFWVLLLFLNSSCWFSQVAALFLIECFCFFLQPCLFLYETSWNKFK